MYFSVLLIPLKVRWFLHSRTLESLHKLMWDKKMTHRGSSIIFLVSRNFWILKFVVFMVGFCRETGLHVFLVCSLRAQMKLGGTCVHRQQGKAKMFRHCKIGRSLFFTFLGHNFVKFLEIWRVLLFYRFSFFLTMSVFNMWSSSDSSPLDFC